MDRAVELARANGIGCVALGNTNHWLRGGSYGWQAAEAGCVGICWTNTQPNMPAWGARDRRIGNNPFVMAVPRKEGHVVVDIAMAQFSYGQMENTADARRSAAGPRRLRRAGPTVVRSERNRQDLACVADRLLERLVDVRS